MIDPQCSSKLEDRHYSGIATSAFQSADILLGEAGPLSDLLLRQALLPAQTREIAPDQTAHVHEMAMASAGPMVYQL